VLAFWLGARHRRLRDREPHPHAAPQRSPA